MRKSEAKSVPAPELHPADPLASLEEADSQGEQREGKQITYYIAAAKRRQVAAQVALQALSGRRAVTGPWQGARKVMPQDFLILPGYRRGLVNMHLMKDAKQMKCVCSSR